MPPYPDYAIFVGDRRNVNWRVSLQGHQVHALSDAVRFGLLSLFRLSSTGLLFGLWQLSHVSPSGIRRIPNDECLQSRRSEFSCTAVSHLYKPKRGMV